MLFLVKLKFQNCEFFTVRAVSKIPIDSIASEYSKELWQAKLIKS